MFEVIESLLLRAGDVQRLLLRRGPRYAGAPSHPPRPKRPPRSPHWQPEKAEDYLQVTLVSTYPHVELLTQTEFRVIYGFNESREGVVAVPREPLCSLAWDPEWDCLCDPAGKLAVTSRNYPG